ncbi:hypothetical protein ZWY2020_018885 [Hordeum vulgare]|nr:hypothetical protein ZWY2020_018885 [Hordeum vulgare]
MTRPRRQVYGRRTELGEKGRKENFRVVLTTVVVCEQAWGVNAFSRESGRRWSRACHEGDVEGGEDVEAVVVVARGDIGVVEPLPIRWDREVRG